jgi:hypothetical protein
VTAEQPHEKRASEMSPWLRYLIAFVVGAHGFTYVSFGLLVIGRVKE